MVLTRVHDVLQVDTCSRTLANVSSASLDTLPERTSDGRRSRRRSQTASSTRLGQINIPREQLADALDRMIGDAGDDGTQVRVRIEPVQPCGQPALPCGRAGADREPDPG